MALKIDFVLGETHVVGGVLNVIFPSVKEGTNTLTFGLTYRKGVGEPLLDSETISCPYDPNGGDEAQQAYEYVKSLERFKDAVDL